MGLSAPVLRSEGAFPVGEDEGVRAAGLPRALLQAAAPPSGGRRAVTGPCRNAPDPSQPLRSSRPAGSPLLPPYLPPTPSWLRTGAPTRPHAPAAVRLEHRARRAAQWPAPHGTVTWTVRVMLRAQPAPAPPPSRVSSRGPQGRGAGRATVARQATSEHWGLAAREGSTAVWGQRGHSLWTCRYGSRRSRHRDRKPGSKPAVPNCAAEGRPGRAGPFPLHQYSGSFSASPCAGRQRGSPSSQLRPLPGTGLMDPSPQAAPSADKGCRREVALPALVWWQSDARQSVVGDSADGWKGRLPALARAASRGTSPGVAAGSSGEAGVPTHPSDVTAAPVTALGTGQRSCLGPAVARKRGPFKGTWVQRTPAGEPTASAGPHKRAAGPSAAPVGAGAPSGCPCPSPGLPWPSVSPWYLPHRPHLSLPSATECGHGHDLPSWW